MPATREAERTAAMARMRSFLELWLAEGVWGRVREEIFAGKEAKEEEEGGGGAEGKEGKKGESGGVEAEEKGYLGVGGEGEGEGG